MSGQPDIHYGLACLEAFFDSHRIASHPGQAFNYRALDGAAESRPIMPYQLPSNSIESRRLRQQRAQETEDILREVGKRHEGMRCSPFGYLPFLPFTGTQPCYAVHTKQY